MGWRGDPKAQADRRKNEEVRFQEFPPPIIKPREAPAPAQKPQASPAAPATGTTPATGASPAVAMTPPPSALTSPAAAASPVVAPDKGKVKDLPGKNATPMPNAAATAAPVSSPALTPAEKPKKERGDRPAPALRHRHDCAKVEPASARSLAGHGRPPTSLRPG